jgi:putative PEP-CTERM system TPR-repeat lipoprotein
MQPRTRLTALALALAASLATAALPAAAQTTFDSADGYYEDASQRAAEGDNSAAVIQLKNALQVDDSHTPSMLLLGELLLEEGQPRQAAAVLSEALLLGADSEKATESLIEAYLRSNQYLAIINDLPFAQAPRDLRAELIAAHAQAQLGLGRTNEAATLIQRAREYEPDNFRAQLASATLYVRRGQADEALATTSALIERAPQDTRAWSAHASVMQYLRRNEDAITAYRRAIELQPNNVDARLSLIAMLVQMQRSPEAQADVDYLREEFPSEPRAAYFAGLLAAQRGDTEAEKAALFEAVNIVDGYEIESIAGNKQLLMIGALSHFGLGNFASANNYLERFLSLDPEDYGALRLRGMALIALDENEQALNVLLKLNGRNPRDAQTVALLAAAYEAEGEHQRALQLLSGIEGAGEGRLRSDAQLGVSQLNVGLVDDSISTLEAVARQQPNNVTIRLPLALAYLRSGRYADAEQLLARLVEEAPDNNNFRNLLSLSLLSQGRNDEAKVIMEDLVERAPDFVPPRLNLAKLAIDSGDYEQAGALLETAQAALPGDAQVVFEQARLAAATGDEAEALRLAERTQQLAPTNARYAAFLVDRYLNAGMTVEAEEAARRASSAGGSNFEGSLLYGATLTRLGKPRQAALLYTQMSRNADFDVARLMQIAARQASIGEHDSAILSLNTVLTTDARYRPAQRALIQENIAAGHLEVAGELAASYRNEHPDEAFGYLAGGAAALGNDDPAAAIDLYRGASTRGAPDLAALGIHRAQRQQGDLAAARATLEAQLETGSDNPRLLAAYSDVLIAQEDWPAAERALAAVLEALPRSWAHWNNRAYVRLQMDAPGAESDAREAHKLAPQAAAVNDTLGWILTQSGRPGEALSYLREATTRDADNPELRYHLGATLAALGRRREAEKELYFALETRADWNGRDAAQTLLNSLQQ